MQQPLTSLERRAEAVPFEHLVARRTTRVRTIFCHPSFRQAVAKRVPLQKLGDTGPNFSREPGHCPDDGVVPVLFWKGSRRAGHRGDSHGDRHRGVPGRSEWSHRKWKAAVRTVDTTKPAPVVTITPDPDPPKNGWVLPGGDAVPAGLTDEGFGAEVRWEVDLSAGHSYRMQVIVHDGDQNKTGGDSAEACVVFCAGGPPGAGP